MPRGLGDNTDPPILLDLLDLRLLTCGLAAFGFFDLEEPLDADMDRVLRGLAKGRGDLVPLTGRTPHPFSLAPASLTRTFLWRDAAADQVLSWY